MRGRGSAPIPRLSRWHAGCFETTSQERIKRGAGNWRAASARAEESVRCGGDEVGCARPGPKPLLVDLAEAWGVAMRASIAAHKRSGRRARALPSDCSGRPGGGIIDPGDLARLNSLLAKDLRFAVESTCSRDTVRAGQDACAERSPAREATATARGVLVYGASEGRQRSASFPVVCSAVRRRLLHSLARSLAECAMTLGLGAGVYREPSAARVTNGARAADAPSGSGSVGLGKSP